MKKPKFSPASDARVMLQIFAGCITGKWVPAKNSPCHKKIRSIIRRLPKT